MKQHPPSTLESDHIDHSLSLVDRMDPAIGEATSVMGVVLTELLRRSLRNGVLKIGDELEAYVSDRVEATLTERTPAIEQAASEVAGSTARSVAAEIASAVASQEVEALERWTKETTHELASQMVEAERRTQHATAESARTLAGQIEETKKEAGQATTTTAQKLAAQIEEVEKRAVDTTLTTAQKLAGQIEEARQRAEEAAHAEMTQQVEDLLQLSRKNSEVWKARFKVLETTAADLAKQLSDEQDERKTELATAKTETQHRLAKVLQRLEQEEKQRHEEIHGLRQANERLIARVAELEKPRGLKAAFSKLFGRREEPTEE